MRVLILPNYRPYDVSTQDQLYNVALMLLRDRADYYRNPDTCKKAKQIAFEANGRKAYDFLSERTCLEGEEFYIRDVL